MGFSIESFLGNMGEYVDCLKNFQNDVDYLRKIVADLKRRRNDKVTELQTVDLSEKQVKEEVQGWLEDAKTVIDDMPNIEEEVKIVSFLSRGSLGRRVRQMIQCVIEVYDRGSFSEGLVIEKPQNLQNDVDDLKRRVGDLKRKRNDKLAELVTVDDLEKHIREKVGRWLEDAGKVIDEMPNFEEEVQNVTYLSHGSLGRRVRQKIQEVNEVHDRGNFPEVLGIERPPLMGPFLRNVDERVDCPRNFKNVVDDRRKSMAELQTVDLLGKQVKEKVCELPEEVRRVIEIEMPDTKEEVQNEVNS